MNQESVFFPGGSLIPWPVSPIVDCCANCANCNTEENECMNFGRPCEYIPVDW